MLKYSMAALALVATSTFALADPNNGGPGAGGAGPGVGSPAGAMKGGATEGNGGGGRRFDSDRIQGGQARDADADRMGKDMRSEKSGSKAGQHADRDTNDRDMKQKNRADRSERSGSKTSDQARDNSRPDKGATGASEGTAGKGGPKGSLTNISPEQQTKVRAAFSGHRVAPARDIGVDVRVGAVVPRSVHFYPLPPTIVSIVPDYSGYEYFMIDDSHVAIVDPDTLEVVDIIVVA